MLSEITFGISFIKKLLSSKLNEDLVSAFGRSLTNILQTRFVGHWKPLQPSHGNAFRSIYTTLEKADPVIREAATQASIPLATIVEALPPHLTIWIDPSEVSYRIGSHGSICHSAVTTEATQFISVATSSPPSSPARPRTPLLPLPINRRGSEALMAPASPHRAASQDRLASPPPRRQDLSTRSTTAIARSPSRGQSQLFKLESTLATGMPVASY